MQKTKEPSGAANTPGVVADVKGQTTWKVYHPASHVPNAAHGSPSKNTPAIHEAATDSLRAVSLARTKRPSPNGESLAPAQNADNASRPTNSLRSVFVPNASRISNVRSAVIASRLRRSTDTTGSLAELAVNAWMRSDTSKSANDSGSGTQNGGLNMLALGRLIENARRRSSATVKLKSRTSFTRITVGMSVPAAVRRNRYSSLLITSTTTGTNTGAKPKTRIQFGGFIKTACLKASGCFATTVILVAPGTAASARMSKGGA